MNSAERYRRHRKALPIDWEQRFQHLEKATFLTLDDAVVSLAEDLMKVLSISQNNIEAKQAILMDLFGNEELLLKIAEVVDIRGD